MTDLIKAVFDDPIGRWVLYAGIFVAAVFGGLYMWTQIRARIDTLADSMGVVREQVTNNHTTNLREEADDRHSETATKLDLLVSMVKGQGESISSLQRGQSELYDLYKDLSIEDTKTRDEIRQIRLDK